MVLTELRPGSGYTPVGVDSSCSFDTSVRNLIVFDRGQNSRTKHRKSKCPSCLSSEYTGSIACSTSIRHHPLPDAAQQ